MDEALTMSGDHAEQNRRLAEVFDRERRRLLAYIRRRVPSQIDAEDLLQDVFGELIEAYRLMTPIAHAGAWMLRVARNRITDLFRREGRTPEQDSGLLLRDLIPSDEAGPEALLLRRVIIEEIEAALDELPENQRAVFIAHEIEGRTFADLAKETGMSINTLLSRKHYAVKHLRRRLEEFYPKEANQ
jgi:RNA polymerase sigma factor (sigma-70 family)